MSEIHTSPQNPSNSATNIDAVKRKRKFWLCAIWISIAGVIIPPVLGFMGTVFGILGAFEEGSNYDTTDPEALAADVSLSLLTTVWGLIISAIAFLILIGVLIRFFTLPKVSAAPATDTRK